MADEAREEEYQEDESQQETEAEERARVQGWMPYEEWVDQGGDPDQWKPAEKFVKDGEEITGIVKERNAKLEREIQQMRRDFQDFRGHMQQQLTKREQKGYDKALKDLQQRQRKAVEEGDVEAFDQVEREKYQITKDYQELESNQNQGQQQQQDPSQDPVFQQWVSENKWYQNSPEMAQYAESIAPFVKNKNPNLEGKDYLDQVTKEVKVRYPDQFKNPNRDKAAAVEGDRKSSGGKKKKTYSDLPSDAKEACNRFVKQGLFKNRDEYVKEYFSGEGDE